MFKRIESKDKEWAILGQTYMDAYQNEVQVSNGESETQMLMTALTTKHRLG